MAFTREVINDPSFIDIETSTLMDILNQDKLNIESELDLFNAINRLSAARGVNRKGRIEGNNLAFSHTSNNDEESLATNSPPDTELEKSTNLLQNNEVEDHEDKQNAKGNIHTVDNATKCNIDDTSNVNEICSDKKNPSTLEDIANTVNETNKTNDSDTNNDNSSDSAITDSMSTSPKPTSLRAQTLQMSASSTSASAVVNEISQRPPINENVLREALKKIRFLTMTPQQFAEGPAVSNLLQQEEALAIFIRISSVHSNEYPMPEGFTTSRIFRNFFDSQRLEHRLQRQDLLHSIRHNSTTTTVFNNSNISQSGYPFSDIVHPPSSMSGNVTGGRINHSYPTNSHPIYSDVQHGNRLNMTTSPDQEEIRRRFGIRSYDPPFDFHPTTQSDRRHLRSPSNNNNHILLRIL